MSNPLLQQMADHAARDLKSAIYDREGEILSDIQSIKDELEEGKPLIFSCSLSIKMNFDTSNIDTVFTYAVKKSTKAQHEIDPDPDQGKLPFEAGDE